MEFHVIKENDLLYLSDADGHVPHEGKDGFGYGLFTRDTRVLSRLNWNAGPMAVVPLQADHSENFRATYYYTNHPLVDPEGQTTFARECLFITRSQSVDGDVFRETGVIQNYAQQGLDGEISYVVDADFADMFIVRGMKQAVQSGQPRQISPTLDGVAFVYESADGIVSRTTVRLICVTVQPDVGASTTVQVEVNEAGVRLVLAWQISPGGGFEWALSVETSMDHAGHAMSVIRNVSVEESERRTDALEQSYAKWLEDCPTVSGHKDFSRWYERGLLDLRMLMTDLGYGIFPVAGVPWYAVPFGRDSLITAWQMLLVQPAVARGTLLTMAAYQGEAVVVERDEEPGKIMHELRAGELTRTQQVPFGPYYGSIDSTPLFLILAAEYFLWTGDREWIEQLLPHIERGFAWVERHGDRDGDGFVEYHREAAGGIANQGWKDSGDAIVHKNGSHAMSPIALCEVQGYVYRAYDQWSRLYALLGRNEAADRLRAKADDLQTRFLAAFWLDAEDTIALALDAQKHQVQSVSSNMGQVLWSGILPASYAGKVIDRLLEPDMFSGYGVRTLSADEVAYNPVSYHNGSIWPHDNSLIAAGMQRYGRPDAAMQVMRGLLRAAERFPMYRLPELFAGFDHATHPHPLPYPVPCSPQAWAAATPLVAVHLLLGICPDLEHGRLYLQPTLPGDMEELRVEKIRVAAGELDVFLQRSAQGDTLTSVYRNTTGLTLHIGPVSEVMSGSSR